MKAIFALLLVFYSNATLAQTAAQERATQKLDFTIKRLNLQNTLKDLERNPNKSVIYEKILSDKAKELNVAIKDYNKSIYFFDDRLNFFDTDANGQKAITSSIALVAGTVLSQNNDGTVSLPRATARLCNKEQLEEINLRNGTNYANERFYDEPAPARCSGVVLTGNIVATAGHCIKSEADCRSTRFITGFHMRSGSDKPHENINSNRVYSCQTLIARSDPAKSDWALVRLDRPVAEAPIVVLGEKANVRKDVEVTVVGYPLGLPAKIAGNATVRRTEKTYFVANLDTFGGNSGSPVFNSDALKNGRLLLEGLLIRGEDDFEINTPCRVSKRCPSDGCRGEDVTFAEEFSALAK